MINSQMEDFHFNPLLHENLCVTMCQCFRVSLLSCKNTSDFQFYLPRVHKTLLALIEGS